MNTSDLAWFSFGRWWNIPDGYKFHSVINWLNTTLQCIKYSKEGNVLFNDALNTFYLLLYGVGKIQEITVISAVFGGILILVTLNVYS